GVATTTMRASLFLSWCHRDRALKEDLLSRLAPNLAILSGVRTGWWEDSHLVPGEDFRAAILDELAGCDYGVLPLGPGSFPRTLMARYELRWLVGSKADRGALPVALRPVPLDGSRTLSGLDRLQIFTYRGRAFSELTGAGRDAFAGELATQIRRRILRGR